MTNGDWFRNMSDEELAEWLNCCGVCSMQDKDGCDGKCMKHIAEWLGQPKEGEH